MENVSKALYISGGVLIAIVIIAALVLMWSDASGIFSTQDDIKKSEQIKAFNTEYEAFNKKLLRGSEIVSVINKAESNNRNYAKTNNISGPITQEQMEDSGYYINIEFEMKEAIIYKKEEGKGSATNKKFEIGKTYSMQDFFSMKKDSDAFTDFKRRVFDCEKTEYNSTTGRINYMKFVERKMNDDDDFYINGI